MKITLLTTLLLIVFLASCKSTPDYPTELYQAYTTPDPTGVDFSRNGGLSAESKNNKQIAVFEKALLKSDPEAKEYLTYLYANSFSLETRKKAIPLLEEFSKKGDNAKTNSLAIKMHLGKLGVVSDEGMISHKALLEKSYADTYKMYLESKAKWQGIIKSNAPAVTSLYQEGFELCQQKADNLPVELTPSSSYLFPKYISKCLNSYSVGGNISARLAAIAKFEQLSCDYIKSGKPCVSIGYRKLASNTVSDSEDEETLLTISIALKNIYDQHSDRLKMYFPNQRKKLPSPQVGRMVATAFKHYENEEYAQAITVLNEALNIENITEYDRAYLLRFSAITNLMQDDDIVMYEEAISNLIEAINLNVLNYQEHLESVILLSNVYISNEQYQKQIPIILTLLDRANEEEKLVPKETHAHLMALFAKNSKVSL